MQNQVISHRDLDPKNVMWNSEVPFLIDWEAAGYVNPYQELLEVINYWADDGKGNLDKSYFDAIVKTYGKHMKLADVEWDEVLSGSYMGMLGWLEYNVKEYYAMKTTFERAREFMYRNARPLDLARFQYHFENGSKEAVINVLSYYQNEDGGCGHAIEADCWNPNSTPLHTGGASEILREIDFNDFNHPLVKGLLKWYLSGEYFDGKVWSITVESNNDYPHAPWWHTDSVSTCHTDYNGTAQIAGFMVRYASRDSEAFNLGLRIVKEAIGTLSPKDLQDMHTCTCYVRMKEYIEKAGVTDLVPYEDLKQKLHESVNKLICTDVSRWGYYVCKPSAFLSSMDSEYYMDNKEISDYQCEHIIKTQLADGSWDISWSWENYPDEWAISKNWWKGQVIIENLLYLKGFGRI